jgi:flagellar motor component MotA
MFFKTTEEGDHTVTVCIIIPLLAGLICPAIGFSAGLLGIVLMLSNRSEIFWTERQFKEHSKK